MDIHGVLCSVELLLGVSISKKAYSVISSGVFFDQSDFEIAKSLTTLFMGLYQVHPDQIMGAMTKLGEGQSLLYHSMLIRRQHLELWDDVEEADGDVNVLQEKFPQISRDVLVSLDAAYSIITEANSEYTV